MRIPTRSKIIGYGLTSLGKSGKKASDLIQEALRSALLSTGAELTQLDGLIAVPSLAEPRFMEAHYIGTRIGLLPHKNVLVRTIDTGGAGPISALLEADEMIRHEGCDLVAMVAGDAVSSLDTAEFLKRADAGCASPDNDVPSPVIPNGYDKVAQWQMEKYGVTREQLAMVSVLMSYQASRHPMALTKQPTTLEAVLSSRTIAPCTNLLECARRADGAAAILVASSRFVSRMGWDHKPAPVVVGGGEASGPLYPPKEISEDMFSCEEAAQSAYSRAQLGVSDIDFFGLYDCYPICFIRAVEAVNLAPKGKGGEWVEAMYHKHCLNPDGSPKEAPLPDSRVPAESILPVNTHGGLLSFGAPWETPAMYNIIEAVAQLNGTAGSRQVPNARRALVYGNGGIFSASAVAILGNGIY
mmetsp:Transcript_15876/g.23909  ORF Transcript_15876/g.23909 Transcript_15876/m.23909 type:complete len:413 (+) Transcript_15876:209-1447(+)|eukprot:CAMPEP_0185038294 /NCGR_PEP_ID=MMETSP1103-20130426/33774_1 /TAXON_ID=36769 /ORGANISM="Paraphysomonas bandaiensis, Strain Caron Lab Isolate" /LENGTH=412 /DNA_ID=CAMNT_0027576663 /DNA_START=130 /DNA_END=1368 /DNA_ORIENTATION=-